MAYTTIDNSQEHFNTVLYTGNGGTNNITGVGHQPDWVWLKERTGAAHDHFLFDVANGVKRFLSTNDTGTLASADNDYLTSFNSDGFSLGSSDGMNQNSIIFTSWNWKANGSGASNTDGTINTTYTSASTTSGFSISTYTGTGANATVGHGLGVVPKMIIVKRLDVTSSWRIYHASIGANYNLVFTTSGFQTSSTMWNNTAPTSSVFNLGSYDEVNGSSAPHVAYCFADVQGFSKFGSYIGNGSANGTFLYTGFKPAFVITKNYADSGGASNNGGNWRMFDTKRLGYNVNNATLYPNLANAEANETSLDLLSNGFKFRGTSADYNQSGSKYVYMALAEEPLVSTNGNAATAR